MHAILLSAHITSGVLGLALGPLTMLLPKSSRWHPRAGIGYQILVALLCTTAAGLVVIDPRVWALGLIAAGTQAAALAGWAARRRARPGWLPWHIRFMCGSYVSFVTAFLVTMIDSPVVWALPTLIATPLIAMAVRRHRPARRTVVGPESGPALEALQGQRTR